MNPLVDPQVELVDGLAGESADTVVDLGRGPGQGQDGPMV